MSTRLIFLMFMFVGYFSMSAHMQMVTDYNNEKLALLNEELTEPEAARDQWSEARDLYAHLGLAAGVEEADQHLEEQREGGAENRERS